MHGARSVARRQTLDTARIEDHRIISCVVDIMGESNLLVFDKTDISLYVQRVTQFIQLF